MALPPQSLSVKKSDQLALKIQIIHGDKIMYDGPASTISSRNANGRFDILPQHTNYISLIKDFISLYDLEGKETQFVIKNGIMRVFNNEVIVFLGFEN